MTSVVAGRGLIASAGRTCGGVAADLPLSCPLTYALAESTTSIAFTESLAEAGVDDSVGAVGCAC